MTKSPQQAIPPQRIVLYTMLFSLLLIVGALWWTQSSITNAENSRATLLALGDQIQTKVSHQEQNRLTIQQFLNKDPLYLHKHLEPIQLLSYEGELARSLLAKSALPEDALLERRLQFLTSGENSLSFVEGALEMGNGYKETVEQQAKPVELSSEDLATLFSLLEEPHDDAPHLIVSEARLERKKSVLHEVWGLSLKIVRREYIPS